MAKGPITDSFKVLTLTLRKSPKTLATLILTIGEAPRRHCRRTARRRGRNERGNERTGQFLDVGLKSLRGNLDPLPPRQTLQAVGQFARLGHCRVVDKNGNDTNVAFERSLNLDPDKIIRIVETTPIVLVVAGSPVPSDDCDKRVTSADAISQDVEPINAKVDICRPRGRRFRGPAAELCDHGLRARRTRTFLVDSK